MGGWDKHNVPHRPWDKTAPWDLYSLNFDAQRGSFNPGKPIRFDPSGASAKIISVTQDGSTGILSLGNLIGVPQNNDTISESALGLEAITDQNDRDFNTDIGNWQKTGSDSGNLSWDETDLGDDDPYKQGLLTAVGDGSLYAYLTTTFITLTTNTLYKLPFNIYVPAGNTLKDVRIKFSELSEFIEYRTLAGDTWTEVVAYSYLSADVTGSIQVGFNGNPANGDLLYFDDNSIKPVLNFAFADGVVY